MASEIPLDLGDFPQIVRDSIEIFNRLPDRYSSTDYGLLYQGKDLGPLPVFYDYADVSDPRDRALVLEIVQHLDHKAVTKEVQRFKALVKKSKAK